MVQVTALLGTLEFQESARRKGHFALFNCLVLGHTKYKGVQRVYCNPFPAKPFQGSHRLDMVIIRPPGIDNGGFVVSPDTVWYAQVLLLFSASAMTDTGSKTFECALVSTLQTYDYPENGDYINLIYYNNYISWAQYCLSGWLESVGSRILCKIDYKKPVLYVIPIESILGRLPVVPVGLAVLVTPEPFHTACAIVLKERPATVGRVQGTDAGCGLSIRGLLAGPAICNERQWVWEHIASQSAYYYINYGYNNTYFNLIEIIRNKWYNRNNWFNRYQNI
jgi:hypothetical protein